MNINLDLSSLESAISKMKADSCRYTMSLPGRLPPMEEISIKLSEGIEVLDLKEVDYKNGILGYKGHQVLLYIPDHGQRINLALDDGATGNKYHVADCSTLKGMKLQGRFARYVVTNDLSGLFNVTGIDPITRATVKGKTALNVCKNCLESLNFKGYKDLREERRFEELSRIFNGFILPEFFSIYSSCFTQLPKKQVGDISVGYSSDWTDISRSYRESVDYGCEKCGVNLSNKQHLLHVHHKNGLKLDNSRQNLVALCKDCHKKEPYHDITIHLRVDELELINRFRKEQGLIDGDSWQEVFNYSDTCLHGLLHRCKLKRTPIPKIGYDVEDGYGEVVASLGIAWPHQRLGVMIVRGDAQALDKLQWRIWSIDEALEKVDKVSWLSH